jgi:hypothetical protein
MRLAFSSSESSWRAPFASSPSTRTTSAESASIVMVTALSLGTVLAGWSALGAAARLVFAAEAWSDFSASG